MNETLLAELRERLAAGATLDALELEFAADPERMAALATLRAEEQPAPPAPAATGGPGELTDTGGAPPSAQPGPGDGQPPAPAAGGTDAGTVAEPVEPPPDPEAEAARAAEELAALCATNPGLGMVVDMIRQGSTAAAIKASIAVQTRVLAALSAGLRDYLALPERLRPAGSSAVPGAAGSLDDALLD